MVQIVEQIIDLIKRGEFPPRAQLPPERELAQRLQVSRASLREALSALQMMGLKAIEPPIAALAAVLCSDVALRHVKEIQDLVDAKRGDRRVLSDGDRKFHLAIAEATRNPALIQVMLVIYELMGQRLWLVLRDSTLTTQERLVEYADQHWAVYEALAAHDGPAAAACAREHLESVEQLMVEWRRAADARDRSCPDGRSQDLAARRAIPGVGSSARRDRVRDH